MPYIDHLPLRYETDEITPREKDEVIARAICSYAAIMCACSIRDEGKLADEGKQGAQGFLTNRYGCIDKLTRMERRVTQGVASRDEAVNMGWKYESLWALMWAMGLVEELRFPSEICDCAFVMDTFGGGDFSARVKLRGTDEILQALDLIYPLPLGVRQCPRAWLRLRGARRRGRDGEARRARVAVLQGGGER